MNKKIGCVLIGICFIILIFSNPISIEEKSIKNDDKVYFYAFPIEEGVEYNLTNISKELKINNELTFKGSEKE